MLRPLFAATLTLVAALGLAGSAAAACDDAALAGNTAAVCALEYQSYPCCGTPYSHNLASAMAATRAGSFGAAAYQYGNEEAVDPTNSGNGFSVFASTAAGSLGVALYQYDHQGSDGSYQGTGFYLGVGDVLVRGGQASGNGACDVFVASDGDAVVQPCGPLPQTPTVPPMPHL